MRELKSELRQGVTIPRPERPRSILTPDASAAERVEMGDPIRQPPEDAVFRLRDVGLWYGTKHAISDISLDIPVNRVTALIGPSGCGKSSLLRCLNRMNDLIPSARVEGTVEYHGADAPLHKRFAQHRAGKP